MKLIRTLLAVTLAALPLVAQEVQTAAPVTESWTIDKSHSAAEFKVRHLMANVGGRFNDFDAVIHLDRTKPANSSVEFTIQATSIDTANKNRDEHLRSPDFFDVAKHPTAVFETTSISGSGDKSTVTGNLTLHGITKQISFPAKIAVKDDSVTVAAEFSINRFDFQMKYPGKADDLIRDNVVLRLDVKATPKAG